MNEIEIAEDIIEDQVRDMFEKSWKNTTQEQISEYRILLWGSIIEKNKSADDLDVIFEYNCDGVSPDIEKSIEGQIRSKTYVEKFEYIDPLVLHYLKLPEIISKSRVSRVYSIDEEGWVEF
jgi:hypothetical protein